MPVDTQQVIETAEKLGKLIAEHPAVERYAQASKAVAADPEASRLFADFDREVQTLAQQEQAGQAVSPGQRQKLQMLQQTIAGNLKVKAFSIAQMEMTEILKKVSQTWQKPVADAQKSSREPTAPAPSAGPRLVYPG